jgi:hypothetical protein
MRARPPAEPAPTRWIDRRAVFLFGAALVSLLLVPASPDDLQYVGVVLAVWCSLLAVASWLDDRSRNRS